MALIRVDSILQEEITATHDDIVGFTANVFDKYVKINVSHGNIIDGQFVEVSRSEWMIQDEEEKLSAHGEEILVNENNQIVLSHIPYSDLEVSFEDIDLLEDVDFFIQDSISYTDTITFNNDMIGNMVTVFYTYIIPGTYAWQIAAMNTVIPGISLFANLKITLWDLLLANGFVAGEII